MLQYDATVPGGHGGGGEYELQVGFGWTNGVIMELLLHYGSQLSAEERFSAVMSASMEASTADSKASTVLAGVATALLALLTAFAAGCIG